MGILDRHCPAPTFAPNDLSDEKARIDLSFKAGKRSVVDDVRSALNLARQDVNKPKVQPEVV